MPVRHQDACPSSLPHSDFTLWVKPYFRFKWGNSASGRAGLKLERKAFDCKVRAWHRIPESWMSSSPKIWKLSPGPKEGLWQRLPGSTTLVFSLNKGVSLDLISQAPCSPQGHMAMLANEWADVSHAQAGEIMKDACPLIISFPCQLDRACGGQCEHKGKR